MSPYPRFTCVLVAALVFTISAVAQDDKPSGSTPADMKEMSSYVLTMDKIQRMAAVVKALAPVQEKHPDFDPTDNSINIDEMVRNFEKYPEAVAAIRANGFTTTRDYVDCLATTVQATVDVAYKRENNLKDYPPDALQEVGRANLDFVTQHWDEIRKLEDNDSGQ